MVLVRELDASGVRGKLGKKGSEVLVSLGGG